MADTLRLYGRYLGVSIRSQMQYPASFWMASAAYCLGLGVPFVYTGLAFGRMTSVFTWVRRHFRAINVVSGLALTLFGLLLLTDNVTWLSRQLIHVFDVLHLDALSSS